ncbi:hypothetical protein J3R82DRAFT_10137 [Butyriboletus roseoflavus]|nr:hypothetical protein J3R82DRAFT_10137 [Butyriboletus roseoflavus]
MPSLSISSALLILGDPEGLPWTSPIWQDLTRVFGVPWDTESGSAPDARTPLVWSWTTWTAESIKNYARNLWSFSDMVTQVKYSSRTFSDNDSIGRSQWNKWIQENWGRRWKMNRRIDEVFTEYKCSPYDTLTRANTRKVNMFSSFCYMSTSKVAIQLLSLDDAQVTHIITMPLAHALLGESAYRDEDVNFLKMEVKQFIDVLIVQTWHRYRKGLFRESKQLEKDELALQEEWLAITQEGATPSVKMIKAYLSRLRRVLTIRAHYQDQKSIEELKTQQKTLEVMLAAAHNDNGKLDEVDKLLKVLWDMLKRLASENDTFPGAFGGRQWQGQKGENIPNQPFVIICPVNLLHQWTREIERFLKWGTFDLFPYTGKLGSQKGWWNDVFTKSNHELCHHIILATESVLQDDASVIFMDIFRNVGDELRKASAYPSRVSTTLYGRQYLTMIMDEAHAARKLNKLHTAACALRAMSTNTIAMTATPVMTKLLARDRKAERESENAAEHLRKLFSGNDPHDPTKTELYPKLQKYIPWLREVFSLHVIRCTLDSIDYLGRKIFGMRPYCEHVMLIELHDWEWRELNLLTNQIIEQTPLTTLVGTGKVGSSPCIHHIFYFNPGSDGSGAIGTGLSESNPNPNPDVLIPLPPQFYHSSLLIYIYIQNFYIEFRHGLLHPHMNPCGTNGWQKPTSLVEWKGKASTKLDILTQIVDHHLKIDNAPPLKICSDARSIEVNTSEIAVEAEHVDSDRIVIFSAFSSSNAAIRDVLALYGIQALELHGKMHPNKRKLVLNEFRSSNHTTGARVLILSMVGTVGLNLACANIMVVADTLWSVLDDEQLRGRIYRYPQQKQVHFYRLVTRGTPDVFLNNIAFDKGMLHLAFVGLNDKALALFNGESNDRDLVTSALADSNHSDPEPDKGSPALDTWPRDKHDGRKSRGTTLNESHAPPHTSSKRPAETSPTPAEHAQRKPKHAKAVVAVTPIPIAKKGKGKGKLREEALAQPENITGSTISILPTTLTHSAMSIATTTTTHLSSTSTFVPALPPLPPPPPSTSAISTPTFTPPPIPIPIPIPTPSTPSPNFRSPSSPSSLFDVDINPEPELSWNPDNDPLLDVMQSSTQQADSDELDQFAELEWATGPSSSMSSPPPFFFTHTSSPMSSPPPSSLTRASSPVSPPSPPSQSLPSSSKSHGTVRMTPGVRPRQCKRNDNGTPTIAGPSNSRQPPLIEDIGGTPLIPGGMGRFKGVTRNCGKGKARQG